MPSTKVELAMQSGVIVPSGQSSTGTIIDVSSTYGGEIFLYLTNPSGGTTNPATIQLQISPNTGNAIPWYNYGGAFVGPTGSGSFSTWTTELPPAAKYIRPVVTALGNAATIDTRLVHITSL